MSVAVFGDDTSLSDKAKKILGEDAVRDVKITEEPTTEEAKKEEEPTKPKAPSLETIAPDLGGMEMKDLLVVQEQLEAKKEGKEGEDLAKTEKDLELVTNYIAEVEAFEGVDVAIEKADAETPIEGEVAEKAVTD